MRTINYRDMSWESFEDLCSSLWFDEGYTNIQPYGHYREGGRDAVFRDANRGELVIFQYKRWTARKTPAQFQRAVRVEIDKIKQYHPKKYILNSALEPSASNNDWIVKELQPSCGFEVEYWDRSWLDLRLSNTRQDLRREYFSTEVCT